MVTINTCGFRFILTCCSLFTVLTHCESYSRWFTWKRSGPTIIWTSTYNLVVLVLDGGGTIVQITYYIRQI